MWEPQARIGAGGLRLTVSNRNYGRPGTTPQRIRAQ